MSNYLFLVIGESGSGKTTVVEDLCEKYGYTSIQSYTTRAKRSPNEVGHKFVTIDEMPDKTDMVAYTYYNGNHYWATQKDAEENDFYVIDPKGVEFFLENYSGEKNIVVIYLTASEPDRFLRMRARGDDIQAALDRVFLDRKEFFACPYDVKFINNDLEECKSSVLKYVQRKLGVCI